ncbi:MAG: hypothetical protein Q2484_16735, partial [Candidatus Sedimenticola sp. (ex Thyasira tokunagai)]
PLTGRRVRMPTLLPLWRAARTTGKQCGLTATGDYQPSLRSPWLAADEKIDMKSKMDKQIFLLLLILVSGVVVLQPAEAAGVCLGRVQAADDYTVEDLVNYDKSMIPPEEDVSSVLEASDAELFSEEAVIDSLSTEEAAAASEALTGLAEGFVISILGSIGGIIDTFSNPNATDLDKAAATLSWVPVIGEILGFLDMSIHEQQQREARVKANAEAKHLNYIRQYETLVTEAADINKLLDVAREAFSREALEAAISQDLKTMTNDTYVNYRKRGRKSAWGIDHYYAAKIVAAGFPTTDNNYAPETHFGQMRAIMKLLIEESTASDSFRTEYFEGLLQNSLLVNDETAMDLCRNGLYGTDSRYKCGSLLLNLYADEVERFALTGTGQFNQLMIEYVQVRNYTLAKMKAHAVNDLAKAASAFYDDQHFHYKHAVSYSIKQKIESTIKSAAKNEFFIANNLDSYGRNRDSACWKIEYYNCLTGTEHCHKIYQDNPNMLPLCYHYAADTTSYCDARKVYQCEMVTYDPQKDSQLQAALSELDLIFSTWTDSDDWPFHHSMLDLTGFTNMNVVINPFAFTEFISASFSDANGGYSLPDASDTAVSVDGIYLGSVAPEGTYSNVIPEDIITVRRLIAQAVELAGKKPQNKYVWSATLPTMNASKVSGTASSSDIGLVVPDLQNQQPLSNADRHGRLKAEAISPR